MGMSKSQIDMQIHTASQRAIAELQQNMMQLDNTLRLIDSNMRNSHLSLMGNIQQLTLRINFILDEMRAKLGEEEFKKFDERFKAFAIQQQEVMKKQVEENMKKQREKEAAESKKEEKKIIEAK